MTNVVSHAASTASMSQPTTSACEEGESITNTTRPDATSQRPEPTLLNEHGEQAETPCVQPDEPLQDEEAGSSSDDAEDETNPAALAAMLTKMGLSPGSSAPPPAHVLTSFDLQGVAARVRSGEAKSVIVMCGAGISVSAGIPDFRTPGTGLYDNLQKYNLPHPQAIFELEYFKSNPQAFYTLAGELHPQIADFQPTPTHHFIRLLHDKGVLRRCWSQNIDSLETKANLPADKLVAAHGNFDTASCIATGEKVPSTEMKEAIMAGVEGWQSLRDKYGGLVKPDIVFFGENLPPRFHNLLKEDFQSCDLLIVMGTSLAVQPFASLISRVPEECPRLLINREKVGETSEMDMMLAKLGITRGGGNGFVFDEKRRYRDVFFEGDCDQGCWELATLLGWKTELQALVDKTA